MQIKGKVKNVRQLLDHLLDNYVLKDVDMTARDGIIHRFFNDKSEEIVLYADEKRETGYIVCWFDADKVDKKILEHIDPEEEVEVKGYEEIKPLKNTDEIMEMLLYEKWLNRTYRCLDIVYKLRIGWYASYIKLEIDGKCKFKRFNKLLETLKEMWKRAKTLAISLSL